MTKNKVGRIGASSRATFGKTMDPGKDSFSVYRACKVRPDVEVRAVVGSKKAGRRGEGSALEGSLNRAGGPRPLS